MIFLGKKNKFLKTQGKSKFIISFGHALDGIDYTITHERNFIIETVIGIAVVVAGVLLNVSAIEWLLLILTIGIILSLEMVNTALERCVDLCTMETKPLAKAAKDVAAGAVLIMSMFSVIIGMVIFLPKIILLLS